MRWAFRPPTTSATDSAGTVRPARRGKSRTSGRRTTTCRRSARFFPGSGGDGVERMGSASGLHPIACAVVVGSAECAAACDTGNVGTDAIVDAGGDNAGGSTGSPGGAPHGGTASGGAAAPGGTSGAGGNG